MMPGQVLVYTSVDKFRIILEGQVMFVSNLNLKKLTIYFLTSKNKYVYCDT